MAHTPKGDYIEPYGGTEKLICHACSSVSRAKDTVISKTSKFSHLRTPKHLAAVMSYQAHLLAAERAIDHEREQQEALAPAAQLQNAPITAGSSALGNKDNDAMDIDMDFRRDSNGDFYDDEGQVITFSVGTHENGLRERNVEIIRGIEALNLYDHTIFGKTSSVRDQHADEDETISSVAARLRAMGVDNEESDDDGEEENEQLPNLGTNTDGRWNPYPSKTMFMLDLLDNLPRLRLSDDQLKAIIWVMKECGTPDVPAFSALRRKQTSLTKEMNIPTKCHTSSLGNKFYMNHPLDLFALDWANPFVRPHINTYPEILTVISETWQAEKYLQEVDLDDLSPMWADWDCAPHRHFYIKELAQTESGQLYIPLKWIHIQSVVYAVSMFIILENQSLVIPNQAESLVNVHDFIFNYVDLNSSIGPFGWTWDGVATMPNPIHAVSKGRPAFILRTMPWCDDVSGNRTKQYNAHMNLYATNLNLPHKLLMQEYFVRFCSTSQHTLSLEQFDALVEDFKPDNWQVAYDCKLQREIVFRVCGQLLAADNPAGAEVNSQAGSNASFNCRSDMSGGSSHHRESDDGYHALFAPGLPRTTEGTIAAIKSQIMAACRGVQSDVDALHTQTGIKDKIALHWMSLLVDKARNLQHARITNAETMDMCLKDKNLKGDARKAMKESIKDDIQDELYQWVILQPEDRYSGIPADSPGRDDLRPGDHYNVLLRVRGLNPHDDTPVEILHTFLLGQDKYVWYETNRRWDKEQDKTFAVRLQSSSVNGLSIPPIQARYLLQYKNSLIGKHFKILQQVGVFHLDESLVSPHLFELWKCTGELGAMLWMHELRDLDEYLKDLQILIDNVLDAWALVDPSRILNKYKLHVLTHLIQDIRRFGPAILYSTEVFECFNVIFRFCSILSNHLAPSHDIAATFAEMERFKHLVSGGWWKSATGEYRQAGNHISNFLKTNTKLQRRLGWANELDVVPGSVKLCSRKEQLPSTWAAITSGLNVAVSAYLRRDNLITWRDCKHVISQSRDVCSRGSWVFFTAQNIEDQASIIPLHPRHDSSDSIVTLCGRVQRIMSGDVEDIVLLQHFKVSTILDERLRMPVLTCPDDDCIVAVSPQHISFVFNAQHDCVVGKCAIVDVPVKQGRDLTSRTEKAILHSPSERYFLNMHGLHNAHLIRQTLPRNLTKPKHIMDNRREKHNEIAAELRVTQAVKRVHQKEAAAATREKNKQARP